MKRFKDNGNGTITDTKTGLIWQQEPISQNGCWEDAIANAKKNRLAGYSNWRLPTIAELRVLISGADRKNKAEWLNLQGFKNVQPNWFWSSSEKDRNYSWYIYMRTGDIHAFLKVYGPYSAIYVRSSR